MDEQKLKEITKLAQESVKDLDPDLRETAFSTILQKLLDDKLGSTSATSTKVKPRKKKTTGSSKRSLKGSASKADSVTSDLMGKINRTDYPLIYKMKNSGDKALYLLQIVLKLGVDGLAPSQVSYLLNEKFRVKATASAVSMALMKSDYVDRRPTKIKGSSGYSYHLMEPGERYLDSLLTKLSNAGSSDNSSSKDKEA